LLRTPEIGSCQHYAGMVPRDGTVVETAFARNRGILIEKFVSISTASADIVTTQGIAVNKGPESLPVRSYNSLARRVEVVNIHSFRDTLYFAAFFGVHFLSFSFIMRLSAAIGLLSTLSAVLAS
jgi:hypothetical protein